MFRPDLYFAAFVVMLIFPAVISIADNQAVRSYLRVIPFVLLFVSVPEQYAVSVFVLYLYLEVIVSALTFLPAAFNELVKI